MTIIFSAFKLNNHSGRAHVDRRRRAIEQHYKYNAAPGMRTVFWYDEVKRLGFHAFWQSFENEKLERCVETEDRIVAYTSFPFGYTEILGEVPVSEIGPRLADRFAMDPSAIRHMHPPFSLIDVRKSSGEVRIYNDVASYDRLFQLDSAGGSVLSNRSLPPFLLSLTTPRLSELGWASEQLSGYMYGRNTAFEGLFKTPPGANITLSSSTFSVEESNLIYSWFTEKPGDTFAGLDRLAREVHLIGEYKDVDIAITGGRDSRASAAFGFHTFKQEARGRTSYPPELEREISRNIAEATPEFYHFQDPDHAVRADGSTLWRGVQRKMPKRQDLLEKAKRWAYILEGNGIATALYGNCGFTSPFRSRTTNDPSVPGIGGELAKAYAYSSQQVSGVFAPNFSAWHQSIAATKVWDRLPSYPPTTKAKLHFVDEGYWRTFEDYHVSELIKAQDNGISGYKFLDFWYLTGRCVGAHNPGYLGSLIMPFFTPEFLQSGAQDTLERKFNVQLSRDIVSRYQPSWGSIPYFDEIQNKRPASQIRYFRQEEYLWSGPSSKDFLEIIHTSPAFDEPPYDRRKLVEHYERITSEVSAAATLSNVKAHSLLYRHAVHELCQDIAHKVRELRDIRLRRWTEAA